ncbi:hypothetical protein BKA23_2087 [Rudaeicoccus suwonensis]|uniref:Uncharacterized protein n=1 Tax=Rudaeicoccus suwonensis TaxID=657409 RepID=A0A561ECB6_9MICO|nr:hypothetical protein BKA23_2087 [Rudaeicoccus suwonensis]
MTDLFNKHYRGVWEGHAANESAPRWLRAACLAYARCQPNGHTPFPRGLVALALATHDPVTGELIVPDRRTVYDAIRVAVDNGWLAQQSCARCLIVPPHAVAFDVGTAKARNAVCTWHESKSTRKQVA